VNPFSPPALIPFLIKLGQNGEERKKKERRKKEERKKKEGETDQRNKSKVKGAKNKKWRQERRS